jgi:transcriptional regulator with XRE-family HTH domain
MNDQAQQNDQTQRIIRIMQDKNMNPTRFAEEIGIQRAAMSHIKLGRNNPSADVLTKIIERFDDINPRWLLTGKGSMKLVSDHPDGLIDFHQPDKDRKVIEKEVIVYKDRIEKKDRLEKNVTKIVVFFSDRTYDTFIPENSER